MDKPGVPVEVVAGVPSELLPVQPAFRIVKLIQIRVAIVKPHPLAAHIASRRIGVEMVVGGAVFIIADLLYEPTVIEALESPAVGVVYEDMARPACIGSAVVN